MKKFIVVFVVFALFGTALFAQAKPGLSLGGFGRIVFEPLKVVKSDGEDPEIGSTVGGPIEWVEGRIAGNAEKIGFETYVRWAGLANGVTVGDNAYIWVKPVSFLTIGAGKINGPFDKLRGKIGFGGSNGITNFTLPGFASEKNEDAIFKRFGSDNGAVFQLEPVDGLVIGAVFNANQMAGITPPPTGADFKGFPFDKDGYKKLQIGAGYTIANIGVIRAQFFTGLNDGAAITPTTPPGGDTTYSFGTSNKIQAAFALTAVEGLTVDIGGTIPLGYTNDGVKWQDAIGVSGGARFAAGDFSVVGRVDTGFAKSYTPEDTDKKYAYGFDLQGYVEPAYNLGAFTVAADVGFQYTAEDTNDGTAVDKTGGLKLGAGVWLGFPLGNGSLNVGVMSQLPLEYSGKTGPLVISLPISLQYFFF